MEIFTGVAYAIFFFLAWPLATGLWFSYPVILGPWAVFAAVCFCGKRGRRVRLFGVAYAAAAVSMLLWGGMALSSALAPHTASADASRLMNDLRAVRSSALLYRVDHGMLPLQSGDIADGLNQYSDRPLLRTRFYVAELAVEGRGAMLGLAVARKKDLPDEARKRLVEYGPKGGVRNADGGKPASGDGYFFMAEDTMRR